MVDIRKLEVPDTVTLLPGATQYLSDADATPVEMTAAVKQIVGDLTGRVLVVGAHPVAWLAQQALTCDMTVVVRGIPDAAQIATEAGKAAVFCGSLASFSERGFDTVVSLTDLSRVLSLEEDPRTWRQVFDDLCSRVSEGGRLICGIENDRGLHRLVGPANPRSSDGDLDWDLMATWDRSRPRTAEQVAAVAEGQVWSCYPRWRKTVVVDAGELSPGQRAARDAAVFTAAARPLFGPDPLWHVEAAAAADRTRDIAAGWLLDTAPASRTGAWRTARDLSAQELSPVDASARPLMAVVGELLAANDVPRLREHLQAWAQWHQAHPETSADLALTVIGEGGEFESIAASGEGPLDAWAALASLVAIARGRGWRLPWPSPMSDETIVSILGAMARLPYRSRDQLSKLIVVVPSNPDELSALDKHELIARLERETAQVHTLRSRSNWTELQFVTTKVQKKVKTTKSRAVRAVRKVLKKALM